MLFDQGTPVQIGRSLSAHSVRTAREQGWSTLANGELLRLAEEAGFDLLLTTDKYLRYQQNLLKRKIAIVVLGNGLWPLVRPMLAQVAAAIEAAFIEPAHPFVGLDSCNNRVRIGGHPETLKCVLDVAIARSSAG